jgi:hypothetical protein
LVDSGRKHILGFSPAADQRAKDILILSFPLGDEWEDLNFLFY